MVNEDIDSARAGNEGDDVTADPQAGKVNLVDASDNQWGVPILDVRPITLHNLSTSTDPTCARNAISFPGDDGRGFIDCASESSR